MSEESLQVSRNSETLRSRVGAKLRDAIATGRFRAGDRLVERELCSLLGVGRTSVREALRQLEAEGLIVTIPHRGPQVAGVTMEEAKQLYEVRALLEGFAGRGCAERATPAQLEQLSGALEALQRAGVTDRSALVAAKTAFYQALLDACGNDVVRQLLTGLHNRITLLRATSMMQQGRIENSLKELRTIYDRIAARDADGAERACVQHIRNAAEVALAVLARESEHPARGGGTNG